MNACGRVGLEHDGLRRPRTNLLAADSSSCGVKALQQAWVTCHLGVDSYRECSLVVWNSGAQSKVQQNLDVFPSTLIMLRHSQDTVLVPNSDQMSASREVSGCTVGCCHAALHTLN